MKNNFLRIINISFSERKVSAKYSKQLNKVISVEEAFTQTLSDDQLKLYRALDHEIGELHLIDNAEAIEFTVKFLSNTKKWTTKMRFICKLSLLNI